MYLPEKAFLTGCYNKDDSDAEQLFLWYYKNSRHFLFYG
jgi:hypothetical protein